jgi:SnoaL-like domain
MNLRELVESYTDVWSTADVERFRTLVLDGCVRHDPGSTVAISLADNSARFLGTHAQFPGLRFKNTWMWEHGADTITVAYSMSSGATTLSGLEVFRFANGVIVEVWNVAPTPGFWL